MDGGSLDGLKGGKVGSNWTCPGRGDKAGKVQTEAGWWTLTPILSILCWVVTWKVM